MCGICGIVDFSGVSPSLDEGTEMIRLLKHRGPDDDGFFTEKNIFIGSARLSIFDLSPRGQQPMIDPAGRYALVYNGEVYNFPELREQLKDRGHVFKSQTDTEVVLHSYLEWGKDCVERFNGMFAFAVWDRLQGVLTLWRDRFGVKPLYYYHGNSRFAFASEIVPVLRVIPRAHVAVNQTILYDYLAYDRIDHTDETFWTVVKKIPPGSVMRVSAHGLIVERWYRLEDRVSKPFESADDFRSAVTHAITLTLRSDVPVGVNLSGGIDSSAIAAIALRADGGQRLRTFSAVYGRNMKGDESSYIDEFSDLNTDMHFTRPDGNTLVDDLLRFIAAQEEPVPRTGVYAQYKVMQLAGKHVKVTLDGQGADEVLGGYDLTFPVYYVQLFKQRRWCALARELNAHIRSRKSRSIFGQMAWFAVPGRLQRAWILRRTPFLQRDFVRANDAHGDDSMHTMRGFEAEGDLRTYMIKHKLQHLLKFTDKNGMRFGVESRVPFLDHTFVERALSTPLELMICGGGNKQMLRSAVDGIVPERIRRRTDKVGFGTPESEWFRTPRFITLVRDILDSQFVRTAGIVNRRAAETLYEGHLHGQPVPRAVWKLVNLHLWYENATKRND